jgi:hypothetical protein
LKNINTEITVNGKKSLSATVLITLLVAIVPSFAFAAEKPNILLIVSDDHGYGESVSMAAAKGAVCLRPIWTRWPTRG